MRFAGDQTIYPCKEHEAVGVPIQRLLSKDGTLDIYPEVSSRGYFNVEYRRGELVLKATRFVGLIPISDSVAIHVQPKAPIANLFYMMWRSGLYAKSLRGFIRGYQDASAIADNPEEVYVDSFLSALRNTRRAGLLKVYSDNESDTDLRGRILIGKTISRHASRGYRNRHTFAVHDHSIDNVPNRILKHTAERLLRHFIAKPAGANANVARELTELLVMFRGVSTVGVTRTFVAREAVGASRCLPTAYSFYEPALWLSYLISTNSGITMETIGRAQFETLIIDVSDVFEAYVRRLLEESDAVTTGLCSVVNGNRVPLPLFVRGVRQMTQPDYYFVREGAIIALADAKYKPDPSAADKYEILGFCEAANVHTAAFICPYISDASMTAHHGTTPSGRDLYVVRIDLGPVDIGAEEHRFNKELANVLMLSPAVTRAQ